MRITIIPCLALLASACLARPVGDLPGDGESSGSATDDAATTTTTPPPPPPPSTTAPGENTTGADSGNDTSGDGPDTGEGLGEGEECEFESADPGCADGLKCMPYSADGSGQWNAAACFPIHPDAVDLYEDCEWIGGVFSGYDNCGDNAYCRDYTGEGGTCHGLCLFQSDDWDDIACEDPEAIPGAGCQSCFCTCDPLCDPLDVDACPEGQACYGLGHPDFGCAPDASGELGAYGDECEFINVCNPGHFCANAEAVPGCEGAIGCCTPFCDTTQPNTCPGAAEGQECVSWYEEGQAIPGYEDVGACVIPA